MTESEPFPTQFVEATAGVIREYLMFFMMRKKDMVHIALGVGFLLLLPLTAMQFSEEVAWDLMDFAIAGVLLFGAGFAYKIVTGKWSGMANKLAMGLAVAAMLLLVWMNLAVGLIGSENHPANLMYLLVLAIGIIGASRAHFRPNAMARVLCAMALAQALITVIALIFGMFQSSGSILARIVFLHGFFVLLFVASALLFHNAGRAEASANS